MTREEAFRRVRGYLNDCLPIDCGEEIEEIIKALEQEPKTEKVIKMRNATPEERESIDKYVKGISKPTGVDFWNLGKEPKILETLDFAIDASNGDTNYFVGFRNGLRYAKSLIDGEEEPQFERCVEKEPILEKIRAEIVEMRSKQNVGVLECLDIIDKYRGKGE